MNSIMGPIAREQLELFALELGEIATFDLVYSLASTNISQSAPNLVTNEHEHRSQMSLIMGQVIPDQSVLSALEIEKLNFSSLFGIYFHCYPVLFSTQVSVIGPSWSSCLQVFLIHELLNFIYGIFQSLSRKPNIVISNLFFVEKNIALFDSFDPRLDRTFCAV